MISFEQVEKLREKTDVSFEEAKKALEETNGDLLEAVINLERQNKIKAPESGGYYHSREEEKRQKEEYSFGREERHYQEKKKSSFGEGMNRFFCWMGKVIHKGNIHNLEVFKDDQKVLMLPLTAVVLLLFFAFWFVIPLTIVGLIFGYRLQFRGPDLDKTEINQTMDKVSEATRSAVDRVFDADEEPKEKKKNKGD